MPVMMFHKSQGTPLDGKPVGYAVFDSDDLPKKSEGWRESPAEALKVRKRGPDSTRPD